MLFCNSGDNGHNYDELYMIIYDFISFFDYIGYNMFLNTFLVYVFLTDLSAYGVWGLWRWVGRVGWGEVEDGRRGGGLGFEYVGWLVGS